MAKERRDTAKYTLHKTPRSPAYYAGISNNLPRRKREHARAGRGGTMVKHGRRTTRTAARRWERRMLGFLRKRRR